MKQNKIMSHKTMAGSKHVIIPLDDTYNVDNNVKAICQLFAAGLPGNTTNEIYHAIAKHIIELSNNPYVDAKNMQSELYLAAHIQSVINQLAQLEE